MARNQNTTILYNSIKQLIDAAKSESANTSVMK